MIHIKNICSLVKKDILLEVRQQYSLYGVLLYVASTIFVVYITMGQPETKTWNALFWIVQLFVCVNAVAKSFLQESKGRMLYFYSLTHPVDFVLSKLIFNSILMFAMSLLSLLLFLFLLGNPLYDTLLFMAISLFSALGLSLTFTFLAAIVAKAQQQASLMAIMGFPLIIPQLLLLGKISAIAFDPVVVGGLWQLIGLLFVLDILIVALSVILFPFLWKD